MMYRTVIISTLAALTLLLPTQAYSSESSSKPGLVTHNKTQAKLGTFGIDTDRMDRTIDPGDDFYRYVNGTWLKTTDIPPDKSSYASISILDEQTDQRVRMIIEEAAKLATPTPDQKRIGDLYHAFMDVETIETKGLKPLENDIQRILRAETREDIIQIMVDRSLNISSIVNTIISADIKNPNAYTLYVQKSGWGLPNLDDYFDKDKEAKKIRKAYRNYLEAMLTEAKIKNPKARAKKIFKFEKRLAENVTTAIEARDPDFVYNKVNRDELNSLAPELHFDVMFETLGLETISHVIVENVSALEDTAKIFADTPIDVLKDFLLVKLLSAHSHILPHRINDISFEFFIKTLRGVKEQIPRWKRGVIVVNSRLGELVGKIYVSKHFPETSKVIVEEMIENLRLTFKEEIETAEWMGENTKAQAQYKLSKINAKIGYPNTWESYEGLTINKDDVIGTFKSIRLWNWKNSLKKLNQPVDKNRWVRSPQSVNAYYIPPFNEIIFPAAILDVPYFDPAADPAVNYGAIGGVIGHEMGHGFDDVGRKFDGDGVQRDWWDEEDAKAFETRADKLASQYSHFEPLPKQFLNGRLSLGENIGDLTGLTMAYYAYRKSLKGQEAPIINGFSGDQRFFMAWAQAFAIKWRDERLSAQIKHGKHSPGEFRVNGVMRNFQPWYDAFNVTPNHALYLAPKDRVKIW